MRKGWIVAIIIICSLLFTVGVGIGVYIYEKGKSQDSNILNDKQLASQEVKDNTNVSVENDVISTSVTEIKLSPNCTIVEKQYFKGCDHLIKEIKEIPTNWINYTEEQIKQQYSDWTLESFTNNQVIIYKEQEGFCPQHYIIREHNGLLGIYTINESGEETLKEDTDISTRYLPEEDLEKVKEGIKATGDDQLHNILGDFE